MCISIPSQIFVKGFVGISGSRMQFFTEQLQSLFLFNTRLRLSTSGWSHSKHGNLKIQEQPLRDVLKKGVLCC